MVMFEILQRTLKTSIEFRVLRKRIKKRKGHYEFYNLKITLQKEGKLPSHFLFKFIKI